LSWTAESMRMVAVACALALAPSEGAELTKAAARSRTMTKR
jgi:hypothetical protein